MKEIEKVELGREYHDKVVEEENINIDCDIKKDGNESRVIISRILAASCLIQLRTKSSHYNKCIISKDIYYIIINNSMVVYVNEEPETLNVCGITVNVIDCKDECGTVTVYNDEETLFYTFKINVVDEKV